MAEGEAFVVDAEEVEESGVKIVDVHGFFGGLEAEVVSFAVGHAAFDSAASHPHEEAVWVMVSAISVFADGGASEFSTPDDEGFFQEAAIFEVGEEGGDGLVDVFGEVGSGFVVISVSIPGLPVTIVNLDEADSVFSQSSGQ